MVRADSGDSLSANALLAKELKPKEAIVWYLYHSGWAIKTQNYLLIFDYIEGMRGKKPANPSLNNGYIHPPELAGLDVIVFASHSHGDHYEPLILDWAKTVKNIKYIFGWKATDDPAHFHFEKRRQTLKTNGIEVLNIHHSFDNIPESAFLVKVDGLVVHHSGDHGSSRPQKNPVFRDNIDYLSDQSKRVDMMFTPTWGGEFYMIKMMNPRFVFPMHDGGSEHQYLKFAQKAVKKGVKTAIITVAKPGDHVFYSKGRIKKLSKLKKR